MAKRASNTQRSRRTTNGRSVSIGNLPARYMQILSGLLSSASFLIVLALCYYLHSNPDAIAKITGKMAKVPALKGMAEYIQGHTNQTVGGLLLAGTAATSAPSAQAFGVALIALFIALFVLQKASFLEYFILSLFTAILLRVRGSNAKLVTFLIIVITIFAGWWGASFVSSE